MSAPDKHGAAIVTSNPSLSAISDGERIRRKSLRKRFREIVWDSLDRDPKERQFIAKIDFFILTWASFSYFSKNLNSNNLCKWQWNRSSTNYIISVY